MNPAPTDHGHRVHRGIPRRIRRTAFVLYALLLVTLTHWPQVRIEGPIPRPDLVIHFGAYGLWTSLLIASAWFGAALSPRNLAWCAPIAFFYAGLDEATQAIPGLQRVVAIDDALANMGGVFLAFCGVLVLQRVLGPRDREGAGRG